eukprot:364034-Chlamydomonas_euryale.AAC.18
MALLNSHFLPAIRACTSSMVLSNVLVLECLETVDLSHVLVAQLLDLQSEADNQVLHTLRVECYAIHGPFCRESTPQTFFVAWFSYKSSDCYGPNRSKHNAYQQGSTCCNQMGAWVAGSEMVSGLSRQEEGTGMTGDKKGSVKDRCTDARAARQQGHTHLRFHCEAVWLKREGGKGRRVPVELCSPLSR